MAAGRVERMAVDPRERVKRILLIVFVVVGVALVVLDWAGALGGTDVQPTASFDRPVR